MENLTELGAYELSTAISRNVLQCSDIMEQTLDRIEAVNPNLNAIISLRERDELMREARSVDSANRRSLLEGLPIAVKDLVETAGLRTTHGSPVYKDHIPDADSLIARRMRDSGLIFIGKTNVPEFGLGSHSYNTLTGVTRNPYDTALTAGGSSGGAAAALAARLLPVADGSDMMGSLRNPGAFCNVYGLRPTYGLVPGDPVGETYLHPLATLGPMARTIEDLALLLDIMAGPVAGDPLCLPKQPSFFEALSSALPDLRIGWLGDWDGHYVCEPEILDVCAAGADVFAGLGHAVEPIDLDFDPNSLWMSWIRLRNYAVAWKLKPLYDDPVHREMLKKEAIYEIEQGLALTSAEIAEASLVRSQWFAYLSEVFEKCDAIALPSTQVMPFKAELDWPKEISGRPMSTYHHWMEIVVPASLIGLPALNLPAGFSMQGLPIGFQLIGAKGSDLKLLQLGKAYHDVTRWPQTRPPEL